MCVLTDFYALAIIRAVIFYTSVTIRRAVVLIQVYGLLHNIFMLFVDIGILRFEVMRF